MAQIGLLHVHSFTAGHYGAAGVIGQGDVFIGLSNIQSRARVSRHRQLHEQHGGNGNTRGNQPGSTANFHVESDTCIYSLYAAQEMNVK